MENEWMDKAKCKAEGKPVSFFFPEGSTGGRYSALDIINGRHKSRNREYQEIQNAKYCIGCPVLEECLDWALMNGTEGVAGGTSEAERRRMRRNKTRRVPVAV